MAVDQFAPSWRSSVTFHDCVRGELISGCIAPNAPPIGNTVFLLFRMGCGSPPIAPYGLSKPPGGDGTANRPPNGGADVWRKRKSPTGKSYASEYDDCTAVRPLPVTS